MRRLAHLAARFVGFLRAAPLTPGEQARVAGLLAPGPAALFWSQQHQDQRHALDCLDRLASSHPARPDLACAALLHDVGKSHVRLGALGRSAATLLEMARIPAPGRLGVYLRHDELGARDLDEAGADPVAVAFAAAHRKARPPEMDPADWSALRAADGG